MNILFWIQNCFFFQSAFFGNSSFFFFYFFSASELSGYELYVANRWYEIVDVALDLKKALLDVMEINFYDEQLAEDIGRYHFSVEHHPDR